jgi:ceramide glucosyltransferase
MIESVLFILVLLSWIYWIACLFLVYDFFWREGSVRKKTIRFYYPRVSILKPVHGLDHNAFENFASFCTQDYPFYEIIFAISDPFDPAVHIVRRLQGCFPQVDIQLLIVPVRAPNEKAALLAEMSQVAKGEVLVISDSDMQVTDDYLLMVTEPLRDIQVGLVTCAYKGAEAMNLPAKLNALHMGVIFLPSVLAGRKFLSMRFALGATIALRASDLAAIGGFQVLETYLADDYQLAIRMNDLGKQVVLSQYIVTCQLGEHSLHEQWSREVRWARTNRVNRPMEYPGLFPLYTITWALLFTLTDLSVSRHWQVLIASIFFRWMITWAITVCTKDSQSMRWLAWLPLRDVCSALVWVCGALSNRVEWRDRSFQVFNDGTMALAVDEAGWVERLRDRFSHG